MVIQPLLEFKACFPAQFFCPAAALSLLFYGKEPYKEGFIGHGGGFRFQDQVLVLLTHVYQFKPFHHSFDVFRICLNILLFHLDTSAITFAS